MLVKTMTRSSPTSLEPFSLPSSSTVSARKDLHQILILLPLTVADHHFLADVFVGGRLVRSDLNVDRLMQVFVRQIPDLSGPGGASSIYLSPHAASLTLKTS